MECGGSESCQKSREGKKEGRKKKRQEDEELEKNKMTAGDGARGDREC